jgi:hypothetical protein
MEPRVVTDKGDMVAHEGLIHQHLKAIEDFEKDYYVNVDMDSSRYFLQTQALIHSHDQDVLRVNWSCR